jgi:hypothetical protein
MVKLSIIYTARDDNYGDDYNVVEFPESDIRNKDPNYFKNNFTIKYNNIERIKFAVESNLLLMEKYFNNDFEIIFIDWNPVKENFLYKNKKLSTIFTNKYVKNIIVSNECVIKEGLNPNGFYEYRGKNVGIRHSNGEFILISNPDDVISEELIKEMFYRINEDNKYYRCDWRIDVDHNLKEINRGNSFPKNGILADEVLGTPASGDFTATSKNIFLKIGGFAEIKSNGNESMLDGRLIFNLYYNNVMPIKLNGNILHLDHKKHNRNGSDNNNWKSRYTNPTNWGLYNYDLKHIENNIYIL